jgi:hypothetical protein
MDSYAAQLADSSGPVLNQTVLVRNDGRVSELELHAQ